jgi:MinD superfamily P-loop ATPase
LPKNNIPVVAKIPNDRKIAELYSKGELHYKKIPEVKIELQKVAEFILEKKERL